MRHLIVLLIVFIPLLAIGDSDSVVEYLESCRKANGAFGPVNQAYTDAAWNYPAVAILKILGEEVTQPEAILKHGIGFPTGHVGYGHWQFFHNHRIRQQLGKPVKAKHRQVQLVHQGNEVRYYGSPFGTDEETFFRASSGPSQDHRDVEAEALGFYNLSSLYYLLAGLEASGREPRNPVELIEYVTDRQAPGGGFVDVRAEDVQPINAEAHVAHTFQSVAILNLLGAPIPKPELCAEFVRSCQTSSGGFLSNPDTSISGNLADVYYTWAALNALDILDQKPENKIACSAWLNSLRNYDGGFGDRRGWRSRIYSTFYAVDSLKLLSASITSKPLDPPVDETIASGRYQIFQALFKVPDIEPGDLKGLHDRGFNLLALKSFDFELAERLRSSIADQRLAMDIVLCPEAYPHRTRQYGGVVLHHIANPTLDPGWGDAQRAVWKLADFAGAEGLDWQSYQERMIRPVQAMGSLVYPEQDFEMELAYRVYDAGLADGGGYNAILAGFNWAPSDFVRVFPWRERYVDKLPPIADADAHGPLAEWSPQLDHTRNLFLANDPKYSEFQDAAANGRVVCVIPGRNGEETAYYGSGTAVDYVKTRLEEWKWW